MMIAEMTAQDNDLYDFALHEFDQVGIPYNLLVTPDGPTIRFPTVVTGGVIDAALKEAKPSPADGKASESAAASAE